MFPIFPYLLESNINEQISEKCRKWEVIVLTIKGLGGFVKIDSGGVTIFGNKVKINEGDSAGKGTVPKMVKPDETDKPQEPVKCKFQRLKLKRVPDKGRLL